MTNLNAGDIGRYRTTGSVSSTDTIPVFTGTSLSRETPANIVNAAGGIVLNAAIDDVSTAGSYWVVSPVAGTVSAIYSVINGAIATADAGLSFEIGGTAITGGGITIANAGSAAGDVDSSTPSAANTVTAGQAIELITDGASTNTVKAEISIVIQVS